jgi:hypothetical protein
LGEQDAPAVIGQVKSGKESDPEKVNETIEEIRFYLEHGMPEQAATTFEKLQNLTRDKAILSEIENEIHSAAEHTPAGVEEISTVESISDFAVDEPAAEFSVDEISVSAPEAPEAIEHESLEPQAGVEDVHVPVEPHAEEGTFETTVDEPAESEPVPSEPIVSAPAESAPPLASSAPAKPTPGILQEFVSDLESSLGANFLPGAVSHEADPGVKHPSSETAKPEHREELEPVGHAAPTTFGISETQPMGKFVADLEASLGDDFLKGAPVPDSEAAHEIHAVAEAKTPVAQAPAQHLPVPAPLPAPPAIAPAASAAAAAAASSGTSAVAAQAIKPQIPAIAAPAPVASKPSPFGEDAGVDLAEMFGELKHDLEVGASTTEEDPETHYNLGIAFREMGLLDEAIGELQKTCQAVDRGHAFPQVMQTYTWLAQCFLDKGVPQAAIRWYDKALSAPGVDEDTRTALHYELAAAYETSGDKPSALKHFMEVYGRNIDYRDVAERIKPLKS